MNPNEPKPQTPLTDDAEQEFVKVHGLSGFGIAKLARSLELKLQEAERQRDEAIANYTLAHSNLGNEVFENGKLQAERDQLRKVADELASDLEYMHDKYGYTSASLAAYSLLPHVQAKKHENSTKV